MSTPLVLRNTPKVAFVDETDYQRVLPFKWYLNAETGYVYGYFGRNKKLYLHRFLLGMHDPKVMVDHKDDNPLNCCRNNLVACTNQQNVARKRKAAGGTSRHKGVCWGRRERKWRATLMYNGKQVYLGTFESEEAAARAYDRKALETFGPFARLNFPQEETCRPS